MSGEFSAETARLRQRANEARGDSMWWSSLASFREMYERGCIFQTVPLPGYPDRAGALITPHPMTTKEVEQFRQFVNGMLDLAEAAAMPEPPAPAETPQPESEIPGPHGEPRT